MTAPVTIWLPGPVRGWERPRFDRRSGRVFNSDAMRRYELALKQAGQLSMGGRAPLVGPLAVDIVALLVVPKSWSKKDRAAALAGTLRPEVKPDFDNVTKMVDGLNKVVWADDVQVCDSSISKRYAELEGLHITVRPAAPAPPLVSP